MLYPIASAGETHGNNCQGLPNSVRTSECLGKKPWEGGKERRKRDGGERNCVGGRLADNDIKTLAIAASLAHGIRLMD